MSHYLDIAHAIRNNSASIFLGAGFTKFLNSKSPSWIGLLKELFDSIKPNLDTYTQEEVDKLLKNSNIDLYTKAQILEGEFSNIGKDIKQEISNIFIKLSDSKDINLEHIELTKEFFRLFIDCNIITTNYDNILSEHVFENKSKIVYEGKSMPRNFSSNNRTIYHIHGNVLNKDSIVFTLNDYLKFINNTNYLSLKFNTLLHENTIIILGYSLGDFNLNSIINQANSKKQSNLLKDSDIFLVTRHKESKLKIDFYKSTFNINVIDETEIDSFFKNIIKTDKEQSKILQHFRSADILSDEYVYEQTFLFNNDFIKIIMNEISARGIEGADSEKILIQLLQQKQNCTTIIGAWSEYASLANWLIQIGSKINFQNSNFRDEYIEIVKYSFSTCSQTKTIGYSWHAYNTWKNDHHLLLNENLELLKDELSESSTFRNAFNISLYTVNANTEAERIFF